MKTTLFAAALMMSSAAIAYGPGKEHAGHDATDASPAAEAALDDSAATSSDPAVDTAAADQATTSPTVANPAPAMNQTAGSTVAPGAPMPATLASTGSVQQPGNENPERDARGVKVISAEAMVPAGFNGTTGTASGGPELDPATGQPASDEAPACSKTVTDNCLQTYERGREPA